jgi:ubiquinone/menaquinone biosynthesis C-methylase UbiE
MRKLLGFKLNALKFVDSISGTLKETVQEATNEAVDISTSSLSVNINKVEHAGFSIYVKGNLLTPENKNDY